MVFDQPLAFTCEVCGTKQPESKISDIGIAATMPNGKPIKIRVYYCTENEDCVGGAGKVLKQKTKKEVSK